MQSINFLRENGINVRIGHSDANFEQTQEAINAGANICIHTFNTMAAFHHRSPNITGAVLINDNIYCEIICDFIHCDINAIRLLLKCKPPEKIILITDCTSAGGLSDGKYKLGQSDIFVKNGVALTKDNILAGSTLNLLTAIKNMSTITNLQTAVNMATINPAKALGVEKEITINRNEDCKSCKGTGAKAGTSPVTCSNCNGQGRVKQVVTTPFGQMATQKVCNTCGGTGKVIKEPCIDCRGKGRLRKIVKIKVKIPEGIDEGQTIVLKGEGEPGINNGPKGDLYIVVHIKRHNIFSRKGDHVFCEVPITFTGATLGTEIEIPMVDGGKEKYRIPEGTQTGTRFTIKNKGFKSVNGNWRGDFVFTVVVQIPKRLTHEQRELLVELAKTMNEQPPIKKKGIFG